MSGIDISILCVALASHFLDSQSEIQTLVCRFGIKSENQQPDPPKCQAYLIQTGGMECTCNLLSIKKKDNSV